MCGIVGYIGYRPGQVIRYSLKAVEYRGYDSVGYYDGNIEKMVGKVDDLLAKIGEVRSPFIAHTRWATHGGVELRNAHPHVYGKIVLVHNGTVNIDEKFDNLVSDTDSERIAAMLNRYGEDMLGALMRLHRELKGTFTLALMHTDHKDRVYFIKQGTPLIIGLGDGEMFVSSDLIAFLPYTRRYIRLEDGDYGYITADGYVIHNNGVPVERPVRVFEGDHKAAILENHPHFMIKEIEEQKLVAESVQAVDISILKRVLGRARVDGVAAGSSYHALMFIRYLTGYKITPYIASEYPYLIDRPRYVLAISQSGETIDTIYAVKLAKERGARIISITNYIGSTLASLSDYVIPMNAGIEVGVAATKTFLAQILFGYRLVDDYDVEAIKRAIDVGLQRPLIDLDITRPIFFVGKGINYSIAMEGALKMKEITYLHAEAFPAGEMKHGPLSLFDKNSQTVFIHGNDASYESAINNYKEIEARGSRMIRLDPSVLTDRYFHIAAIVYLQRLAYNTAVRMGRDPDKPRFLAKAITVE